MDFIQVSLLHIYQQTVELLNDLYQHFDDCVDAYNVWKVETIGDAYLVASGVPDQHENHATEICKMSLDLLSKVMSGVVCVSVKILGLGARQNCRSQVL